MGLTLTVLGCDGGYPGPGGAASGYLVRGAGTTLWLDAGPGTLANLQRHVGLDELDAVVLSHEHPDHRSDVEGLDVALSMGGFLGGTQASSRSGSSPGGAVLGREQPSLPVYAPAGLAGQIYHGASAGLVWHEVADGDRIMVGGLTLVFSRTDHGPPTLAVRVDGDGACLGYSADSGPGWSLQALGADLDLALCEATYCAHDEGSSQHMSARQAAASAIEAGAARLLLTHRWPTVSAEEVFEEASAVWGRPVDQACIGGTWEVGPRAAGRPGNGSPGPAGSASEAAAAGPASTDRL